MYRVLLGIICTLHNGQPRLLVSNQIIGNVTARGSRERLFSAPIFRLKFLGRAWFLWNIFSLTTKLPVA